MKRHFPDFLTAYFEYAQEGFCPDAFHLWTGVSIIGAALERKCSLQQDKVFHVPNLYIMLVSHPAVGKSTAVNRGAALVEKLRVNFNPNFRIIPNQVTEPGFIELMKIVEQYQISPTVTLPHSSGYFYASEASSSGLQNTFGDFIATLTEFYDCNEVFRKKLKGEKETTVIENGCVNMLAGTTFEYLKRLVHEDSVMGGFASRLIYVVAKERPERKNVKWDGNGVALVAENQRKLVEDLFVINRLAGPFTVTQEYKDRWQEWYPRFNREQIERKSPRMESIMSRKNTNVVKLSMILSVSESNSMIVEARHWDKALAMMDEVTKDNGEIIASALIGDKTSQAGTTQLIGRTVKGAGGRISRTELDRFALKNGNDTVLIKNTIDFMIKSGYLGVDGNYVTLLIDPDTNL